MFGLNIAYAAEDSIPLLDKIVTNILNPIVGLLLSISIIVFLFGIVEFLSSAENISKNEEGKKHMIWGLIGIFIIVSVNGIMKLICDTIGASC